MKKFSKLIASCALLAVTCAAPAFADEWQKSIKLADGSTYPSATVSIIAPFAAGGGVDMGIRLFAKHAKKYSDATIIVENITGGSGLIGIQNGLNRPANGYTLWHIDSGSQYVTTEVSVCPFDVLKDMALIGQFVADDRVWVVSPNEKRFNDAAGMIKYIKEHPGELSIATSGSGTIASLVNNYLEMLTGGQFNIIGYNGASEAKAAFYGGHCDVLSNGVVEASQAVAEGRGRVILSLTGERVFPDAECIAELGYKDVVYLSTNRGLAMSAKTDPAIVKYWSDVMAKVTSDPEYLAEAAQMKLKIRFRNTEEFTKHCETDFATWRMIKEKQGL